MSLFLFDPVLRAPVLGVLLMALSASWVGVLVSIRRSALLGEMLSHAAYPGLVGAAWLAALFSPLLGKGRLEWVPMVGAFLASLLALSLLHRLRNRLKISADAAMAALLALGFGIGVLIASQMQFAFPAAYRSILGYLFGQMATMRDIHLLLYGSVTLLFALLFYTCSRGMLVTSFDRDYAATQGLSLRFYDALFHCLTAIAIVLGMRTVGVILTSAMLIIPAATGRFLTHRLLSLLCLSGLFGLLAAAIGVFASAAFSQGLFGAPLSCPAGPLIVLASVTLFLVVALFAREKGLLWRSYRLISYKLKIKEENHLKLLWKGKSASSSLLFSCWLCCRGALYRSRGEWKLTPKGEARGSHLIRLHRLWELYLAKRVGMAPTRVHRPAEEIEHILTRGIEEDLDILLSHPKEDPHDQPIPQGGLE